MHAFLLQAKVSLLQRDPRAGGKEKTLVFFADAVLYCRHGEMPAIEHEVLLAKKCKKIRFGSSTAKNACVRRCVRVIKEWLPRERKFLPHNHAYISL